MSSPAEPVSPITHYENFPVASFLCPPHLRSPITAIYHFARTADDIADEGEASAAQRLADLKTYRQDLASACAETPSGVASQRWPQVFGPLEVVVRTHGLPHQLLRDLLDAFVQDVEKTRDASSYASHTELLDYCRRSANPVGRLLLHLCGITDSRALEQSDAICTALQLINFWQDLSVDIPRGRFYMPLDACQRDGVLQSDLLALKQTASATNLIATCAYSARSCMVRGIPLVHGMPGRTGWELRLVVQGGLRILDKMETLNFATLTHRPVLKAWDYTVMLWRALWM